MSRSFLAVLLLASLAAPAAGKVLCPPGRFTLYPLEETLEVVGAGMPLELGAGRAELPGLCADAEARWFHAESGNWLSRVRARFSLDHAFVRGVAAGHYERGRAQQKIWRTSDISRFRELAPLRFLRPCCAGACIAGVTCG